MIISFILITTSPALLSLKEIPVTEAHLKKDLENDQMLTQSAAGL
jgi:hypothetical protein